MAAQLGHAGLVGSARSRHRTVAPSPRFSLPAMGWVRGATRAQLDEVVDDFARAARVAEAAGFDGIELHLGHGYLLSSVLSPNLNRRRDEYGGSLENRSRFPRRVVEAVRRAVGDRLAVWAKLNMADGVDGGLWLDESIELARLLEADGHLDALELTGGSSYANSMYLFRGEVPLRELAASQGRLAGWGLRLLGRRMFRRYPFEEAYFLPYARQFRAALSMPLILLGGINRLDTVERLAEGFDLVAMARRCSGSRTWSRRCGPAPRPPVVRTATSACRPSTGTAACSCPAERPGTPVLNATGRTVVALPGWASPQGWEASRPRPGGPVATETTPTAQGIPDDVAGPVDPAVELAQRWMAATAR